MRTWWALGARKPVGSDCGIQVREEDDRAREESIIPKTGRRWNPWGLEMAHVRAEEGGEVNNGFLVWQTNGGAHLTCAVGSRELTRPVSGAFAQLPGWPAELCHSKTTHRETLLQAFCPHPQPIFEFPGHLQMQASP